MGYSLYKVVHQPESVGNRLKEVQDGVQDLAKFGKMVQVQSFLPFEYAPPRIFGGILLTSIEMVSRHWKSFTISQRVSHQIT